MEEGRKEGWEEGRGKGKEGRKEERKKEGRMGQQKEGRKEERKEGTTKICVCLQVLRCNHSPASVHALPIPSWTLPPTLLPLPTSPHLVSLSLSLCPQTPSLALTPHPKHSTPLPLCRSFSHPSLHFGPLHQHCSPPGVKSVLCVWQTDFRKKKEKKTGYVVIVHFRTFRRKNFIQVIDFGWSRYIPRASCHSRWRPRKLLLFTPNSHPSSPP